MLHCGGELAQQIVGCAVVHLARVAEAPGYRGERHHRCQRLVTQCPQQVVDPHRLDVEDEVELLRILGIDRAAALQPRGVHEHVHLVDPLHDALDCRAVGHVARVVVHPAASLLHAANRLQRRDVALDAPQLPIHHHRRDSLLRLAQSLGHFLLEPLAIRADPRKVRIARVGQRRQVQQVERALRPSGKVRRDRRGDRSAGARHHEHRVRAQRQPLPLAPFDPEQRDPKSQPVGVTDLDRSRIALRLFDHDLADVLRGRRRLEVHHLGNRSRQLAREGLGEAAQGSGDRGRARP